MRTIKTLKYTCAESVSAGNQGRREASFLVGGTARPQLVSDPPPPPSSDLNLAVWFQGVSARNLYSVSSPRNMEKGDGARSLGCSEAQAGRCVKDSGPPAPLRPPRSHAIQDPHGSRGKATKEGSQPFGSLSVSAKLPVPQFPPYYLQRREADTEGNEECWAVIAIY